MKYISNEAAIYSERRAPLRLLDLKDLDFSPLNCRLMGKGKTQDKVMIIFDYKTANIYANRS
jgi:hypothetical protein